MNKTFQKYARYYDLIYKDKSYAKECIFVENLLKKYRKNKTHTVLDLACGTGGHALILRKKGYGIIGVDVSDQMISVAKEKAAKSGLDIDFKVKPMQDFTSSKKFDAVVILFASIGYLTGREELIKLFRNVSTYLKNDGILIFDFWNGFAVSDHYSQKRMKIVTAHDLKVRRTSSTKIDLLRHNAYITFNCIVLRTRKIIARFNEVHKVRFFFPQEMKEILTDSVLKLIKIHPFLTFRNQITADDWYITAVAAKK